jgi:cell division protein FtsL
MILFLAGILLLFISIFLLSFLSIYYEIYRNALKINKQIDKSKKSDII